MEVLAIAIWAVVGVVAAPVFCLALVRLVGPRRILARIFFCLSVLGLSLFAVDLLLVASLGAIQARQVFGASYFPIHSVVTLFSAASLAGASLLGRRSYARDWGSVAAVCWLVGVFSIFFQYAVGESFYGVDGRGGPYSQVTNQSNG